VHLPLGTMLWDFLFPPAYAGDLAKYDILGWKVPETGVDQYVKKVEEVLNKTSQAVLSRGQFPASLHGMFHSMILAMAWQESCFRQFIEKDHKLTYVLSYNNTSVGLMQVNERIWRGIYDRERLRWDIEYNAAAGNEIAALYLQRYALRDKKVAQKLEPATIARLVYAMYNGGPGQYHDFLERLRRGKMLSSDDVFLEKYSLVTSGKREKLSQCLSGN
jgi:Uri superfamily endonuclease